MNRPLNGKKPQTRSLLIDQKNRKVSFLSPMKAVVASKLSFPIANNYDPPSKPCLPTSSQ